jgi:hypothetical protein
MQKKILPGLRTTFWVHLVVGGIFGLGYLLIPELVGGLFGVQVDDVVPWRLVGAAICSFAASSWWAAHETEWERVRIVVEMEIIWTVLAGLVFAYAIIALGYPLLVWVGTVMMALFAIAFGYFYALESAAKMSAVPH